MDFKAQFARFSPDPIWLEKYLSLIKTAAGDGSIRHHILPKSAFPEFRSFHKNSWNLIKLSPRDHLFAHFYLYRAITSDFGITRAFQLMAGNKTIGSELELQEVAKQIEVHPSWLKIQKQAALKGADIIRGSRWMFHPIEGTKRILAPEIFTHKQLGWQLGRACQIGQISPNKGNVFSQKSKEKLRKSHLGLSWKSDRIAHPNSLAALERINGIKPVNF